MRAARIEAAALAYEGGDEFLISFNKKDKEVFKHGSILSEKQEKE